MKKLCLALFMTLSVLSQIDAQNFTFDKGHTFIHFSVNRFAAVNVLGRFDDFEGSLSFDTSSKMISSAEFTIKVESINTGHDVRDGHLKQGIWLDAENHPEIRFSATSFSNTEEGFLAMGELTIKGVTKNVSIPFQMNGPGVDPTKQTTIGISAEITINRQDYGISLSKVMDNGKMFIGNDVHIEIEALAQLEPE